jgi:hypothetical protein
VTNPALRPSLIFSFLPSFELKSRFFLSSFQTLYTLSCRVSPSGGGEICRAATICILTLDLEKVAYEAKADQTSLMYEVSKKEEMEQYSPYLITGSVLSVESTWYIALGRLARQKQQTLFLL